MMMNDFDDSSRFYEFVCLAALFEGGGVGVFVLPRLFAPPGLVFFVIWAVHSLFLLLCLVVVVVVLVYCFMFPCNYRFSCLLLVVCCLLLFVLCCCLLE